MKLRDLTFKYHTSIKEIAKEMGISRSYVSRIEKRALTKILSEFIKNKNRLSCQLRSGRRIFNNQKFKINSFI